MANGRELVYPSGGPGGGGAPTTATYLLETANGSLPNAFALGTLATGILKNTTTTGVPSIAAGSDVNTTFGSQTQNQVYAAPSGGAGNPAFRALVAGDIPSLTLSKISDAGTIASQNANSVNITGGTIAGATIGNGNTVTLKDTLFTLQDDGDTSKQLQFQLSGISTATTRTLTVPNISDTLVTLTATQVLTNKTLTTPTIASFTNATHTHQNAAGGGTLDVAAIATGTLALARGGTNADLSGTGAANSFLKQSSSGAAVTVGTIASADINTALTTPGAIGGSTANTGAFTTLSGLVTDAATATVTDIITIGHNSSGAPAASYGTGILMQGQSSTNTVRSMAHIYTDWLIATDASRVGEIKLSPFSVGVETLVVTITPSNVIITSGVNLQTNNLRATAGSNITFNGLGKYIFTDADNIQLGTTTGTKFGTATTQKLAFWNVTPIVQPTTGIAAATFVANTSGIANDTATFDGYTLGQLAKIIRNLGLAA